MNKFLACLASIGLVMASAWSAQSVEELLTSVASYEPGQDDSVLVQLEQRIGQLSGNATLRDQAAARIASCLASPQTTPAARLFLCQQLRSVGGPPQVPLLASMLRSADTSDMARLALQAIPGDASMRALIDGLSQCEGNQLAGIIHSIGARRAKEAVLELAGLFRAADKTLSEAAARALGSIGTPEAAECLLSEDELGAHPTTWDALLLCAQNLAAEGRRTDALRLYERLSLSADQPARSISILTGRVRAAPAEALPWILEALRSDTPAVREQGSALSVLVPGDVVGQELSRELPDLSPAAQSALVRALADRGERGPSGTVVGLLDSPHADVRLQALEALGHIGTVASVDKLLRAAKEGTSTERQVARHALEVLSAPKVDERIADLAQSSQFAARTEAIQAMADRRYAPAVGILLRLVPQADADLQTAAFNALSMIAEAEAYPELIECALRHSTPGSCDAAERALVSVAQRLPKSEARFQQPLLDRLGSSAPAQRCSLLRVLGILAGPEALRAIAGSLADPEPEVRDVAVRALADWPDLTAIDEMLKLSLQAPNPVHRSLALRGYLRLALEAAPSAQPALLARGAEAARTQAEKRILLSALAESAAPSALDAATQFLNDASVQSEAAVAVLNLAAKVRARDPVRAETALEELIENVRETGLLERAKQQLREDVSTAETMTASYGPATAAERQDQIRASLPPEDKLLVFVDCGVTARGEGVDGVVARQLNGKPWTFEGSGGHPCEKTVAFDGDVIRFEITGLQTNKTYALGFSWWDGDSQDRSESITFEPTHGAGPIPVLAATQVPKQLPGTVQVPVAAAAYAQGRLRVAFRRESGPNAVISELWLIGTKPGSRSATQVVRAAAPQPAPVDLTPPEPGSLAAETGLFGAYAPSQEWTPPTDPAVLAKLQQWQDRKFGVLITWGTYCQWGIVESWSLVTTRYSWNKRPEQFANATDREYQQAYENLLTTFNPTRFNADRWADAIQDSGVKYVLSMAKHHDGFCMFDTSTTDYRITSPNCPFHADARADTIREISVACRKRGLSTGIYFSKADWHHPGYWRPDLGPGPDQGPNYNPKDSPELWRQFKEFTWTQIAELMAGYGPQDVLWLDGGSVRPPQNDIDLDGLAAMARQHQPGLIVVDRTVRGPNENYITPEGSDAYPRHFLPYPWEICDTLAGHWPYVPNDEYKSAATIVRNLCRVVGRGGNYLVGIGANPEGELDPMVYARLKEIGVWLKLNGEAIYSTRPVPPYERADCVFTGTRDGTLYAIIVPGDDQSGMPETVTLPAEILAKVSTATLIGYGSLQIGDSGTIALPAAARARPPCAAAWAIKLVPKKAE